LGDAVTSIGALNGTVVVRPCITAVAVPVAVSTPFTSATLVMFGIMLMLGGVGGVGKATASGSPLVITSTDSATTAETILFFVLIILFSPLLMFRFCSRNPLKGLLKETKALSQLVPSLPVIFLAPYNRLSVSGNFY
jgi:hypothetical protein